MDEIGSAAAVLLAVVLTYAASAKLRRPHQTAASFRSLGLPAPAGLAVAVPVVELAVAIALLVLPSAGGWLAFALLALFTAVLGGAWSRAGVARAAVRCACFGATSDAPVDAMTFVRNGALLAAALAATFPSRLDPSWPGFVAVGALAAAVGVVLSLGRLRQRVGGLFTRVGASSPRVGASAPEAP